MAFPKTLARFYFEALMDWRGGVSLYYILRVAYKVLNYILPAFLAKFVVGALESRAALDMTIGYVTPTFIIIGILFVAYVGVDISSSWVISWLWPRVKKAYTLKYSLIWSNGQLHFIKIIRQATWPNRQNTLSAMRGGCVSVIRLRWLPPQSVWS